MAGATRSIVINAPIEKVFEVIADYEKYPEFLTEVKGITVKNRKGNECDVHYEADIVKTIKYALHLKEEKPNKVSWTFLSGEFMKDNKGGWVLESEGPNQTKATYNIEVTVGMLVPKSILNVLVDSQLPKMMEAFKARAER